MLKSRLFFNLSYALFFILLVFISGCYEVDQEIIRAKDALPVRGLVGIYEVDTQTQVEITSVPYSNDYRFRHIKNDGSKSGACGYLRAMPLRDDIYIVQIKFDNEDYYYIRFYRFTGARQYVPLSVNESVDNLAKEYDIEIIIDPLFGLPDALTGAQGDILAFLLAHKKFPFSEVPEQEW